jgi:SulP family sulfate permease
MSSIRKYVGLIPIPGWLVDYQPEWFRADVIAGLTASAVVIPQAMAYATIAGLPVQIGLYTILVPMVIYAVLGTSRPLSVSTTSTIGILTAAQLALVAPSVTPGELIVVSSTLAMLVGVILVLASVLRLGIIASLISEPVLTGFKAGVGLVIILDQLPKLLGIHYDKGGFLEDLLVLVGHLPETSIPTLLVGGVMLFVLIVLRRFAPRMPAPLVAVAIGIAASALLGLPDHGVAIVGHIPQGLPSPTMPDLDLLKQLWPGALGIALISFTESTASARAFAKRTEPRPEPNRELLAIGVGNGIGGLFGAMPSGGGTSQTAVNRLAGARTQVAPLITVAVASATLLFLAPLMAWMPMATLAAVVTVSSFGLIKPEEFFAILRIRRMEFLWAVVACFGVVLLGTLKGIVVAIVVSLLALSYQSAHPRLYVLARKPGTHIFRPLAEAHPDDESFPGLLMVRPEGSIFFANAQVIGEHCWELIYNHEPRVLIMDFSAVPDIEYSALKALIEAEEKIGEYGVEMWLVALNPEALRMVQLSSLGEKLGKDRLFFNLQEALKHYMDREDEVRSSDE